MSLIVETMKNSKMVFADASQDLKRSMEDVLLFAEITRTGMEKDVYVLMDMLDT